MKLFPSSPPDQLPAADLYACVDSFGVAVTVGAPTVLNDSQDGANREGGLIAREMIGRRQYPQP